MKFHKDILVIDFEGLNNPLQVGAVLLDKETLEEKNSFVSYIYAELEGDSTSKSGITQEMVNDAPRRDEVGKIIYEKFGTDIFLASFVQNLDITHFQKLLSQAGIDFIQSGRDFKKYDYHVIDIWAIAYAHLVKNGYTGGYGSEEIFQYFGATPRGLHDALQDCRLAADVFRKIMLDGKDI